MLGVKVVIWPNGHEAAVFDDGRMDILSVDPLASISVSSACLTQAKEAVLKIPDIETIVPVRPRARRAGLWVLLQRALDQLFAEG